MPLCTAAARPSAEAPLKTAVVGILADALGHTNSALAKLAIGEGLSDADARAFDEINDALEMATTLLGRVGEFVAPEALDELRRGGGL